MNNQAVPAFGYLSVLVSIILGLGMTHVLAAAVKVLQHRKRVRVFWPAALWASNLFWLMLLVWWSGFSLNAHDRWTFAQFASTVAMPVLLYVAAGLILPGGDGDAPDDLRDAYDENRILFFVLVEAAIADSFLQTFLLDGRIFADLDTGLKVLAMAIIGVGIAFRSDAVQKAVAAINAGWLLAYVSLLFFNLRGG